MNDPEGLEQALANPTAHWDNLEDRKAKLHGGGTWLQGQSTLAECVEEYGRGSAERKRCMANLARLCAVKNLPLHIGTRPRFMKFMKKWDSRWPSTSKQSLMRLVERQSEELGKEIKKEMEVVAAEMDIGFTTDFWMSPTGESSKTMIMHWIIRDWRLKTHILGTINIPKDHTDLNISNKLMDLRLEFGVYPKNSDGKTPLWPDVVRLDKLLYFQLETRLNKSMLTSDCGSNVSAGAKRDELWDWNRCVCHRLNIAGQAALKEPIIEDCLAPLTALAHRFSKSLSAWNQFKKTQMEILNQEEVIWSATMYGGV